MLDLIAFFDLKTGISWIITLSIVWRDICKTRKQDLNFQKLLQQSNLPRLSPDQVIKLASKYVHEGSHDGSLNYRRCPECGSLSLKFDTWCDHDMDEDGGGFSFDYHKIVTCKDCGWKRMGEREDEISSGICSMCGYVLNDSSTCPHCGNKLKKTPRNK